MLQFEVARHALEAHNGRPGIASGHDLMFQCPAHEDDKPSLSLAQGNDGKALIHCHAGCSPQDILAALDLPPRPALKAVPAAIKTALQAVTTATKTLVATYPYCDADGFIVRQKVRYEPKDFRIRHQGTNGEWVYKAGDGPSVLYRLPEIQAAIAEGTTVWIVEGEKDADRLASLGLAATTNIEGASKEEQKPKWRPEYTEQLKGAARVILLPDNDDAGRSHMRHIAKDLRDKVKAIHMVELPGLPPKGDVSDWLDAGHTKDVLLEIADATPHHEEPTSRAPYPLTEIGNAQRFVDAYGKDVKYCYARGCFYVWDGKAWRKDEGESIMQRAKHTASVIADEAKTTGDKTATAWAKQSARLQSLRSMLALAQDEISVKADAFDTDPWLLNVANGTLDLRTETLLEHQRDNLMTKCLTVAYDPTAKAPLWEKTLDTLFDKDKDLISFAQRAFGYSLTGDVSEQVLFFMYGSGKNGKSTFIKALTDLLNHSAFAGSFKAEYLTMKGTDNNRNQCLASLQGKRLVVVSEVDGSAWDESIVKDATGGDDIQARFLYERHFTFKPSHKLWLYGNAKPRIRSTDDGIWRRICLLPFTVTISEQDRDKHLSEKLREELPGILAWAVRGCAEWRRIGLQPPASVTDATIEYRGEEDSLAEFVEEEVVFEQGAIVAATTLWNRFRFWAESRNEAKFATQTRFGRDIKAVFDKRGVEKRKTKHGVEYLNVTVKPCFDAQMKSSAEEYLRELGNEKRPPLQH